MEAKQILLSVFCAVLAGVVPYFLGFGIWSIVILGYVICAIIIVWLMLDNNYLKEQIKRNKNGIDNLPSNSNVVYESDQLIIIGGSNHFCTLFLRKGDKIDVIVKNYKSVSDIPFKVHLKIAVSDRELKTISETSIAYSNWVGAFRIPKDGNYTIAISNLSQERLLDVRITIRL